jgi:Xaa-Pro aminopeptidase
MMTTSSATVLAGIPSENCSLYHRVRFAAGDPAAWLVFHLPGQSHTEFIVRDIEAERARRKVPADKVSCPADYTPEGGLSSDRATATAQSVAECLRRHNVDLVKTDRTLPYIFAWHIQQAGIAIEYDPDLGVLDRRAKDEYELDCLASAQAVTEEAMLMACQSIARAQAQSDGSLWSDNLRLTCERVQAMIMQFLQERNFQCPHGMIVATTPDSADCHEKGSGPIRTGEAVIIDIYPMSNRTRYFGDCTRTVVHGQPNEMMQRMHAAVLAAKQAATDLAVAGQTGDAVHAAARSQIESHGFRFARGVIDDEPVMPHGTGHGIGLEVHEPILLDEGGEKLLAGEVLTIEPGLYSRRWGGVRVEDMVAIRHQAPAKNFNSLPTGLDWR